MTCTCVCCGKEVPEGRFVCLECEKKNTKPNHLIDINTVMKILKNTNYIYYSVDDALDLLRDEFEDHHVEVGGM